MNKMITHSKPSISIYGILYIVKAYLKKYFSTQQIQKECCKILCKKINRSYGVLVNSGTSALHLMLTRLIKREKNEVIVSGYCCSDVVDAIRLAGGNAVFLTSPFESKINKKEIEELISIKTAAIIIQHTFGRRMYIKGLEKLCIPIIEDCTHSFFPLYEDSYVVLSFGATKVITSAEGGGIFLNSESIYFDLYNRLKGNGHYPYRQSDIHSALLYSQIILLKKYIKKRKRIACLYTKNLSQFNKIGLPELSEYIVIYRYVLRFADVFQANAFIKFMKAQNIMCERPITPCPEALKIKNVCSDTETIVSLPIYPSLKKREIKRILKTIYKMEMI